MTILTAMEGCIRRMTAHFNIARAQLFDLWRRIREGGHVCSFDTHDFETDVPSRTTTRCNISQRGEQLPHNPYDVCQGRLVENCCTYGVAI